MYSRIETLEELRERGARFEYEAICDNYVPGVQNTDRRAEGVHFAVALRNFAIVAAIVLAFFLAPRAINAWKLYAYSQSPLWSKMYEQEIRMLEQEQQIDIPALMRNVSAGIGTLLLIAFIHRRFNRIKPRPNVRGSGRRSSVFRRLFPLSSRLFRSCRNQENANTQETSLSPPGVKAT